MLKKEIWIDFYKSPETHEVSSLGKIRNKKRGSVLNCSDNGNGYKYFCASVKSKRKNFYVHRAVYLSFNKNINGENLEINHKDLNKSNNSLMNLELVTRKQNMEHAKGKGIFKNRNVGRGERHGFNKYKKDQIIEIYKKRYSCSARELSLQIGIPEGTIAGIWRGESWRWATIDINAIDTREKRTGVDFHKIRNKFRAQVSIDGRMKEIGHFNSKEEAYSAIDEFKKGLNNAV